MSGNLLTIISSVAGIALGFLTSWWFARAGRVAAKSDRTDLLNEVSTLRDLLNGVVESIAGPDDPPRHHGVSASRINASAPTIDLAGDKRAENKLDILVRASLGTLLDERGQVSPQRLLRQVGHALPGASFNEIAASLEGLRRSGKVSWDGNDVRGAETIRVHI